MVSLLLLLPGCASAQKPVTAAVAREFLQDRSVFGCASTQKPVTAAPPFAILSEREKEFYLDAYQEMFAWRGDAFPEFTRYFVSFKGKDAPADLLDRLRQKGFRVYAGSRWRSGRGMGCEAGAMKWLSPTKAQFMGGWHYGDIGGQWGPLVFVERNGHWKLVSFTMVMVSYPLKTGFQRRSQFPLFAFTRGF